MFGKQKSMEHTQMNSSYRHQLQVCDFIKIILHNDLLTYSTTTTKFFFSLTASEFNTNKPRSIVVREGEHLRLRCAANGNPPPNVEWIRQDERAISFGAWELSSVSGEERMNYLIRFYDFTSP